MRTITIRKLDHTGLEKVVYAGVVLSRNGHELVVSSTWQGPPTDLGYVFLKVSDRWTEYYYSDRWYNVFEIRDEANALKGWYCNVTRPACIDGDMVAWEDLALDLWVNPDGTLRVLDEDEFQQLPISQREREQARDALTELRMLVHERGGPFAAAGLGRCQISSTMPS